MGEVLGSDMENAHVRVTVDGSCEGFWVRRLPGESHAGIVNNVLTNGAIGFGDVVEWNDTGDVMRIRSRSNRATLVCAAEFDPDDLVMEAEWQQACKDAHTAWTDAGAAVESGLGLLIAAFEVRPDVTLWQQALDLLSMLPRKGWKLHVQLSPVPGMTTDPDALGITELPDDDYEEEPDPSGLPDISDHLLADAADRGLLRQLRDRGHIHAALTDGEVLSQALHLLTTDMRCYQSCQAGKNDQVLVLASQILSFERGLLTPPSQGGAEFDTDYLAD